MMGENCQNPTLIDIYDRLGTIEAELKYMSRLVDSHHKELEEHKEFRGKISAYIWLGGTLVSGVFFFLFEGLKLIFDKWMFPHI